MTKTGQVAGAYFKVVFSINLKYEQSFFIEHQRKLSVVYNVTIR